MSGRARRNAASMQPDPTDDLHLLADRLRLGLPLHGFDGREIPLRDRFGAPVDPIDAARALLASAASLLSADYADIFLEAAIERARDVEAAAWVEGATPSAVAVRVSAVLVSAAVRAGVIARGDDVSPSAINRAVLSWYQLSDLRRRELINGTYATEVERWSA
jgi:hypothetical protein